MIKRRKVTIFGAGEVVKYLLTHILNNGICADFSLEIVLFNRTIQHAQCVVKDLESIQYLQRTSPFQSFLENITLYASDNYDDIKGSDIVIIAIGANMNPDLMRARAQAGDVREWMSILNYPAIVELSIKLSKYVPESFIITVTNQADFITYALQKLLNKDPSRIVGFGGALDSNRFRRCLKGEIAEYLVVNQVMGYVAGYHNSDMLVLSNSVTVNNRSIFQIDELTKNTLASACINEALIKTKKYGLELIQLNRNNFASSIAAGSVLAETLLAFCFGEEKSIIEPCCVFIHKDTLAYELYDIHGFVSVPVCMAESGFTVSTDILISEEERMQLKLAHNNFLEMIEKTYDLINPQVSVS